MLNLLCYLNQIPNKLSYYRKSKILVTSAELYNDIAYLIKQISFDNK